jgi:putative transposase
MSPTDRRALVDRDDPLLAIVAQCRLLKIARSTRYYRPAPADPDDLAVMRRMDELYLASPFYGSRRMVAILRREGFVINRKRVRRLTQVMGLEVETATVMAKLELVISIDTGTAHLAATLGCETWVLQRHADLGACWRWNKDWYPNNVRVFQQPPGWQLGSGVQRSPDRVTRQIRRRKSGAGAVIADTIRRRERIRSLSFAASDRTMKEPADRTTKEPARRAEGMLSGRTLKKALIDIRDTWSVKIKNTISVTHSPHVR